MTLLQRLFGGSSARAGLAPLYAAIVAAARAPIWYEEGGVADTIDGRFDMIAALLALALARLERESGGEAVLLTETFVDDMDGQLRELGVGDVGVGKRIGQMMSALGGRLGAYRAGIAGDEPLEDVLVRNLYRGARPGDDALALVAARFRAIAARLENVALDDLLRGAFPAS